VRDEEESMIGEADAVVIGSGALGASIAYHLSRLGQRVALLERHALVSQTSPRAAGLTGQVRTVDGMTLLAMLSVRKLVNFEAETGEPLTVFQAGSLKIARRPEHEEQLEQEVERGNRLGLVIKPITPAEASERNPMLRPVGFKKVTFTPSDLYLEPGDLPRAYLRAAARLGATLLEQTPALGIETKAGAVERVVTAGGEIRAPVVVDAAGAWTRLIGDLVDLRVPLVPTRHQLLITAPLAGVEPMQPITRVIDANVYARPADGGLMLGGYEPDPLQFEMDQLAPTFQIADLPLDRGVLERLADSVVEQLPIFQTAPVAIHRGGLPTMTPDGRPLVGPAPGLSGFYIASGCCVGGLSISPGVGEVLADTIVRGRSDLDLSILRPDRFDDAYQSEERLRAACYERYANQYSVH
jgi:glycine/D-amino acid oxidase-like deaminating enzyme